MTVLMFIKHICDFCGFVREEARFTSYHSDELAKPPEGWVEYVSVKHIPNHEYWGELDIVCPECNKKINQERK